MTSAGFSGDSRYVAVLSASRSGFTVNGRLDVQYSSGSGAWSSDPVSDWAANVAGTITLGKWAYDFRSASTINVWALSKAVSSPGNYPVGGWADMQDGKGRGQPADMTITVPANSPAAPSTPSIARVSDTSQTISWNRNASAAAPYTSQAVQRRTKSGTTWGSWSTVSTVTTDYTNSGSHSVTLTVTAFAEYQYQIVASNGTGSATSGVGSYTFSAPTAPSTPTVTRVSDTSQTVAWNRTATATRPYTSQQLQRRQLVNGAWSAWTGVNTVSTGYSTAGANSVASATTADAKYQYRVKATNAAGEAYSGTSVDVLTTPDAPSAFTATKQTSGAITLALTQAVSHDAYTTTVQYSTDGGTTWTALTTLATGVSAYTHASPPTGSAIIYRAQVVNASSGAVGNGLASAWKSSNSVALQAPPLAPSSLSPNGIVYDASGAYTFKWKHNPVDSSVQSAYEIQYRIGSSGAYTSTGKITSSVQSRVFPADAFVNGNSYEWQVRTYGAHATASPWSPTSTFITSAPPSVTIVSPVSGTPLTSSAVLLDWNFNDPEGSAQSMWEATLTKDGQPIESRSNSGPETEILFLARLSDATTYQAQVRGRDGAGLWSTYDQVTFTTSFPTPNVPVLSTAVWDVATGAALFSVTNPDGGQVVISNDLMRSLDGGQTWELVDIIPASGDGSDPTIPLGIDVLYKAVAWTDLPSSAESPVVVINSSKTMVKTAINLFTNPGFETASGTVEVRRNLATDPRATANLLVAGKLTWMNRWFGSNGAGTPSLVTGAVDGPAGTGITSYLRKLWTTASTNAGDTGFSFSAGDSNTGTVTTGYPVTPGQILTFSAYMRGIWTGAGRSAQFSFYWRDAAGAFLSTINGPVISLTNGSWDRYSATVTVPAGAATVGVNLDPDSGPAWAVGSILDGTGLLVELAGVVRPYCDGSTPAAGDFTYAWLGTVNASQSVQRGVGVAGVSTGFPERAARIQSTDWVKSGSQSLRIVPTTESSYAEVSFNTEVGQMYTVVGTIRRTVAGSGVVNANFTSKFFISSGANPVLTYMTTAPNAPGEYEVRATFTADTAITNLRLGNGYSVGDAWWDDVAVVAGEYLAGAFSGSTPSDGTYFYNWTNTPEASVSEKYYLDSDDSTPRTGGYWSAGEQFVEVIRLNKNQGNPPKMDLTVGKANRTLHYFAGRTKPVETLGEATSREGSVEFTVSTVEEMQQAREMALLPAPHLIRLPDNTILYGSIESISDIRLAEGWYQISFNITEVDL